MSGIRVSEKYGVNPSVSVCWYCGGDNGELILAGRLPGDAEAPRRGVWTKHPCATCAEHMKAGVMLIGVRDGESGDTPYRTGRIVVLKDDAIRRMVTPTKLAEQIIAKRCSFIDESTWTALGLPT